MLRRLGTGLIAPLLLLALGAAKPDDSGWSTVPSKAPRSRAPSAPASPADAASIRSFIPKGYELLKHSCGDLNRDAYRDCVLVLRSPTEADTQGAPRPTLILLGQPDGTFRQVARNDQAPLPFIRGLPETLHGITVKDGFFTLEAVLSRGETSGSFYATFRYDPTRQAFFLHRIDLSAGKGEAAQKSHYTSKDFGTIPFESYSPTTAVEAAQQHAASTETPSRPTPAPPAPGSRVILAGDLPQGVQDLIPEGYAFDRAASGSLNNDDVLDYALVVHRIDSPHEGARPLLLILGGHNGEYSLAFRNDAVVRPESDRSRGSYDPFTGIAIKDGYFTVEHTYRDSEVRRALYITFKYNADDGHFYLRRVNRTRYLAASPKKVTLKARTEKDFGTLEFEQTPAQDIDD